MSKRDRDPKHLLAEIVDKWQFDYMLDSNRRSNHYTPDSIGKAIRRLSPEDHKVIETLTAADVKEVRPLEFCPHPSKSSTRVFRIPHVKS